MRRILLILCTSLVASGCGDEGDERPPAPTGNQEQQEVAPEEVRHALYDDQGNLLESDEVVAGLTLPRGLEPAGESDRLHAYRTSVPLDKLQAYFGPRLVTGQVDRHGSGAIFREAVPRDARGGIVKMDVALLPMNRSTTRVEIREIPPAPQNPPDEADVLRAWREEQGSLD